MRMKKIAQAIALTMLSAGFASSTHAKDATNQHGHFGWQADARGEFGGDELAKVYFTNGGSQSLKAGQGFGFNVGGHYRFANSPFDLSATIGLKYATTAASNADIKATRMVLEFLGTYFVTDDWWLSAGPVLHKSIKLDGDGYFEDVNFDDASGVTFKGGWRWIGLQYTNIKYKASAPFVGTADASSIGVVLVGRF